MNSSPILPEQRIKDIEHLALLRVFHYVLGGIILAMSSMAIFHVLLGLALAIHPHFLGQVFHEEVVSSASPAASPASPDAASDAARLRRVHPSLRAYVSPAPTPQTPEIVNDDLSGHPEYVGYLIAGVGGLFLIGGWTFGAAHIYSGICMQRKRRRVFSLIVAGVDCVIVPFGTILAIFTFVVLLRPSVGQLYAASSALPPVPGRLPA